MGKSGKRWGISGLLSVIQYTWGGIPPESRENLAKPRSMSHTQCFFCVLLWLTDLLFNVKKQQGWLWGKWGFRSQRRVCAVKG